MTNGKQITDSYWVVPGRLMAGEYPGAVQDFEAREKLRWLLRQNIGYFLDLTHRGESALRPYANLLEEEASQSGRPVIHNRFPIRDMGTPSQVEMTDILNAIDQALEAGHNLYLHCYGGIGRTGTVVGCFLVRHGMSGEAALQQIARLREETPDGWKRSPETDAQWEMVLNWKG